MLIATRALLGVAGATIAPSTLSLIRNMFLDPRQRTTAIGIWITSFSVGGAIGPLVGGLMLEAFWWGSVFLIAVPVMVLLLVLGPRLLPEYRDPSAGPPRPAQRRAVAGRGARGIFGLKRIAQDGLAVAPVLFIVAGAGGRRGFVRRQLRLPDPLIDLRLFRMPAFSASLATYGLSILFSFGGFLFLPQYLQLVLGLSPFRGGLWTLPWALGFVVGSMLTPVLVRRIRPAFVMAGGLAARGDRLRDVHAHRCVDRVRDVRGRLDDVRARAGAGVHADHRPGRRLRAARAGRRGVGDLGDQRRIRRRARHRDLRQHRRGGIPGDARRRAADGCPGPGGGRGASDARRCGRGGRRSSRRRWAPS